MKKGILIKAGTAGLVLMFLFSIVIISAVIIMFIGAENAYRQKTSEMAEDIDYYEEISITGIRKGDALSLKVKFLESGYAISGIRGKISKGSFTASKKQSKGKNKSAALPGPPARLDFCSWMSYTAVTATGSEQYRLLNDKKAHNGGPGGLFRMYGDRYCVALGSYYARKIGTKVAITFKKNGKKQAIKAVLGDQKSDAHTDSTHRYHDPKKTDGHGNKGDGSVVEFVMAGNDFARNGTAANSFGTVVGISTGAAGGATKLSGKIDGKKITVTGQADGQPIEAEGTIKNGKVKASGYAGNPPEGFAVVNGKIVGNGKYCYPVPSHTTITSGYGPRSLDFHRGVDFGAPVGAAIVAGADGTVTEVQNGNVWPRGKYVFISHGGGWYTRYQHNNKNIVRKGQKVKKGQKIAEVGQTGQSFGSHCHFEVYKGGPVWGVNDVNPALYLK